MKNRKKLLIALTLVMVAFLFYRLAFVYILETAGVVLIIVGALFFIAALIIFALYFEE